MFGLGTKGKVSRDITVQRQHDREQVARRDEFAAGLREAARRRKEEIEPEVKAGRLTERAYDAIDHQEALLREQLRWAAAALVRLKATCPDMDLVREHRDLQGEKGPLQQKEAALVRQLELDRIALDEMKAHAKRQRDALGGNRSIGQPVRGDAAHSSLADELEALDRRIATAERDLQELDEKRAAVSQERVENLEDIDRVQEAMRDA